MRNTSVLIVDQSLEQTGVIANTAFVLGLSAGRQFPASSFGEAVLDGDGTPHAPLTCIGHYVRKAGQSKMRALRAQFLTHPDIVIVDYTEDAAPADYAVYAQYLGMHAGEAVRYRAIYFYGPEEVLLPATKNLSRL